MKKIAVMSLLCAAWLMQGAQDKIPFKEGAQGETWLVGEGVKDFLQSLSKKRAFLKDVDFIIDTLLEDHPGSKNKQDPDFMTTLHVAKALAYAKKVSTKQEHIQGLKELVRNFDDRHLAVFTKKQRKRAPKKIKQKEFSIQEWMPGVTWITLPTFWPQRTQVKQLNAILEQLPQHRNDDILIFDVRGNDGGNTAWATRVLEAFFGRAYAQKKLYGLYKDLYSDWRVSEGNIKHICTLIDRIKKEFGQNSKEVAEITRVYNGMITARAQNKNFFADQQPFGTFCSPSDKKATNLCSAKIIVLIDERCFSACLDFLDQLKSIAPEATLIGKTTDADTVYMDVRLLTVPSELGVLQIPIQVYRNRRRASNEPYHPDIAYEGDFSDTQAVKKWLEQHL